MTVVQIRRVFGDYYRIIFLVLHKNICCGYSLESPRWGDHNICCMEKYGKLSINYHPAHLFQWKRILLNRYTTWFITLFITNSSEYDRKRWWIPKTHSSTPGAVARSEASSLGMQAAQSLIPTSGTFFDGDLVMKTFLRPFSLFRWFKKSSCQLMCTKYW